MIQFTTGNLLDSEADALVNTVNTVGVMGKGIALMFKERFPENFRAYADACKAKEVEVGRMFVTERKDLVDGPKWIINFPTKKHWRNPSKTEWVAKGLDDLATFLIEHEVRSVALPPLGAGNGGLDWHDVRPLILEKLGGLEGVSVVVYEPTARYQNVAKAVGTEKLTDTRALIVELVRRYMVLGLQCSNLEIQKLAYLLERTIERLGLANPMKLEFKAHKYGPFTDKLRHVLHELDGSYLHSDKRVADATALDAIRFEDSKRERVSLYLATSARIYLPALDETTTLIEGFESPLGMEALATVDWLLHHEHVDTTLPAVRTAIGGWLGGGADAERKLRIFGDDLLELAIERVAQYA